MDLREQEQFYGESKFYPFTEGIGLVNILEQLGYKANLDMTKKNIKISEENKFLVVKSEIRPDNIRKKIKVSFHKNIMKIINEDLKNVCEIKSNKNFFGNLPQSFIKNLKKEDNAKFMEFTFEELLFNWKNEKNEKAKKYLENNPDICQKSKWNTIKNMKYKELFDAFFLSAEFEKSITDLKNKPKNKNVDALYLENYIYYALNFTEYYSLSQYKKIINFPPRKNAGGAGGSERETVFGDAYFQYETNITKYNEEIFSEIFDKKLRDERVDTSFLSYLLEI